MHLHVQYRLLTSMMDTYSDALGIVDFQRSQHGSGMSKRGQVRSALFLNCLVKSPLLLGKAFYRRARENSCEYLQIVVLHCSDAPDSQGKYLSIECAWLL